MPSKVLPFPTLPSSAEIKKAMKALETEPPTIEVITQAVDLLGRVAEYRKRTDALKKSRKRKR